MNCKTRSVPRRACPHGGFPEGEDCPKVQGGTIRHVRQRRTDANLAALPGRRRLLLSFALCARLSIIAHDTMVRRSAVGCAPAWQSVQISETGWEQFGAFGPNLVRIEEKPQ